MTKPIHILNGPNLNLLGEREPAVYGRTTLDEIEAMCAKRAGSHGLNMVFRQTNHEGELIDWIQAARGQAAALIINPAAYTHTSVALHDALKALEIPVIEVHLSQPAAREPFRAHSYAASAATGSISGFGADGYLIAIDQAARLTGAVASQN